MSVVQRVRDVMPRQARLRSVPLVTKLVAAVLALVFAALALISVGSTIALRSYLASRTDEQLTNFSSTVKSLSFDDQWVGIDVLPPTDYYVFQTSMNGVGHLPFYDRSLKADDLPPVVKGVADVNARANKLYTVRSINKKIRWRMLITILGNGSVLYTGQRLSGVDLAVARLMWIDLLVGGAVLVTLASVGAAVVRHSVVPLVQIERTAAAIAAGDLSRRVPDPESGCAQPRTELGRLSRALNAMLTQIETAFTARAMSESAARAAESSAREAAEAAKQSEARALHSEQKMRQFVADASHELRTPLTTIRGFAELYRQGAAASPDETARVVRRIEDEAFRMGLLVEDLLLLARLDQERPLALAPVELLVLAMDAVQAARATAPNRAIELDVPQEPTGLVAYGDDARLRQVIGNLMTNALVHTPPDARVTLRLRAESDDVAVLDVIDTGPGLSTEQTERVFERFYRADSARTRRTDRSTTGTGLGLAIVAAIVRAHHGSVQVLSNPGAGSTFRLRLPLVSRG